MLDRTSVTHHVPGELWAPPRTRVRALCGASIVIDERSDDPTCPVCRLRLREDAEAAARTDAAILGLASNWRRALK